MNFEDFYSKLDEQTKRDFQELQIYEQAFEQILAQKRAFKIEIDETEYAIKELEKSKDEVFKIVASQVILKYDKNKLIEEMKNKKDILTISLGNIEKQESEYSKKIEELKKKIIKATSNK